jgi:hypothetical protein
LGYEELSPQQTAQELLGHLPAGSKVAFVSYSRNVQAYLDEMQQRGLVVRAITPPPNFPNPPLHDFCFLMHAQHELVGLARSTFLLWAALFAVYRVDRDPSAPPFRVLAYSVDSIHRRQAMWKDRRGLLPEWRGVEERLLNGSFSFEDPQYEEYFSQLVFEQYNWTHSALQKYVDFKLFKAHTN